MIDDPLLNKMLAAADELGLIPNEILMGEDVYDAYEAHLNTLRRYPVDGYGGWPDNIIYSYKGRPIPVVKKHGIFRGIGFVFEITAK